MFLRLILLIPMIRQFMLLDVEEVSAAEWGRMERERSEIPLLLARAVVNMHEHDWAPAEVCDLWVDERYVRSHWWQLFGKPEPVYETMRVVEMGFGLFLTGTGLVLEESLRGSHDGRTGTYLIKQVTRPAEIDSWRVSSLHRGLQLLASYAPTRI
jgi:hypothetical protein